MAPNREPKGVTHAETVQHVLARRKYDVVALQTGVGCT